MGKNLIKDVLLDKEDVNKFWICWYNGIKTHHQILDPDKSFKKYSQLYQSERKTDNKESMSLYESMMYAYLYIKKAVTADKYEMFYSVSDNSWYLRRTDGFCEKKKERPDLSNWRKVYSGEADGKPERWFRV